MNYILKKHTLFLIKRGSISSFLYSSTIAKVLLRWIPEDYTNVNFIQQTCKKINRIDWGSEGTNPDNSLTKSQVRE